MRSTSDWSEARFGDQDLDFGEVKGQQHVKRAVEVAAAGGHNRTYSRNGPISDALVGTKQISFEQLRKVLGLESVRDLSGLIKPRPLRRSLMAGDQTRRQALKGSSRQ